MTEILVELSRRGIFREALSEARAERSEGTSSPLLLTITLLLFCSVRVAKRLCMCRGVDEPFDLSICISSCWFMQRLTETLELGRFSMKTLKIAPWADKGEVISSPAS